MRTIPTAALVLPLAVLASAITGCASGPISRPVTVDGLVTEWNGPAAAAADEHYLYARFSLGRAATIAPQSAQQTTRIAYDLDDNPDTGRPLTAAPGTGPEDFEPMGIDLEILFSPPGDAAAFADTTEIVPGASIVTYSQAGLPTVHPHADAALVSAPTHASDWFELRVERLSPALRDTAAAAAGQAAAITLRTNAQSRITAAGFPAITGFGSRETFTRDAARPAPRADVPIPSKPAGAIRVLSYNTLRGSLTATPEPFARVIAALAPDVILFQEMDGMSADDIEDWLNENVGPTNPAEDPGLSRLRAPADTTAADWSAAADPEAGVAVATPHRLAFALIPTLPTDNASGRRVRAAAAVLRLPIGELVTTSVHFTCCGGADGPEENARRTEADLLNAWLDETIATITGPDGQPLQTRIVGGDINLVGTRRPLEILAQNLGTAGRDLAPAEAAVLGDRTQYTWREDTSAFSPGRLDWILHNPAATTVAQAFAIDTRRMTGQALDRSGLLATDSEASDHLPLVVDLIPR